MKALGSCAELCDARRSGPKMDAWYDKYLRIL